MSSTTSPSTPMAATRQPVCPDAPARPVRQRPVRPDNNHHRVPRPRPRDNDNVARVLSFEDEVVENPIENPIRENPIQNPIGGYLNFTEVLNTTPP